MAASERAALSDVIEVLERVGCQGSYCDGPTLEPESMVTCYLCETLARARVILGRAPREPDEETWLERHDRDRAAYMAAAVH